MLYFIVYTKMRKLFNYSISKLYSYFRKKLYNYKIGIIGEDYY